MVLQSDSQIHRHRQTFGNTGDPISVWKLWGCILFWTGRNVWKSWHSRPCWLPDWVLSAITCLSLIGHTPDTLHFSGRQQIHQTWLPVFNSTRIMHYNCCWSCVLAAVVQLNSAFYNTTAYMLTRYAIIRATPVSSGLSALTLHGAPQQQSARRKQCLCGIILLSWWSWLSWKLLNFHMENR